MLTARNLKNALVVLSLVASTSAGLAAPASQTFDPAREGQWQNYMQDAPAYNAYAKVPSKADRFMPTQAVEPFTAAEKRRFQAPTNTVDSW